MNFEKGKFQASVFTDYSSFMFWKPMNWRDFTFVMLRVEFDSHAYFMIHAAVLGVHFWCQLLKS